MSRVNPFSIQVVQAGRLDRFSTVVRSSCIPRAATEPKYGYVARHYSCFRTLHASSWLACGKHDAVRDDAQGS